MFKTQEKPKTNISKYINSENFIKKQNQTKSKDSYASSHKKLKAKNDISNCGGDVRDMSKVLTPT